MPLYEYHCENCHKNFEVIQKFSDQPLEVCRLCNGGPVAKQLSAPGIHFKGSGWYVTDYAKSGGKVPASDGGKTDQAEKSGGTETKTDTKSDTKSTPAPASAPAPATKSE
jgi:putative FmdB family regulatory protein